VKKAEAEEESSQSTVCSPRVYSLPVEGVVHSGQSAVHESTVGSLEAGEVHSPQSTSLQLAVGSLPVAGVVHGLQSTAMTKCHNPDRG
jgi:hypothetical protein